MNEETMDYQINKGYSERPKYRELMRLIEAGLFRGNIVEFDAVPFGCSFITSDGAIYKKINKCSAYYKNGTNAITHGEDGIEYRQFLRRITVKELIPMRARPGRRKKPTYTESYLNFEFSTEKAYRCRKVDTEFCNLQKGDYFNARRKEGIWKKIPRTFKRGRSYNAIARLNRRGLHFAWFNDDDQVKHLIEVENYMNPEDILAEIGLVDKDLELNIQVKPQTPEHKVVATVPVTCTKFRADYTSEDAEIVCAYSIDLKIGDHVAHISEKEKVEVEVKGEMLVIIPVKRLANRHGFIAQVTGGSSDTVELPVYLGSGLCVQVTKLAE